MAVSVDKLYEAYTRLDRHIKELDFEAAIKTSQQILAVKGDELEAQQALTYSFAQTNRFSELLEYLTKPNQLPKDTVVFQKAYSLYRLQRHNEALKLIASVTNPSTSLRHLEAQCYFRLEDQKCVQLYESLFASTATTSTEVLVNLMASLTRSNRTEAASELVAKNSAALESSYDLVFNAACALIEANELLEAETRLREAEKKCREALKVTGAAQEEINAELAPILAQLAYVRQRLGDEAQASKIYEQVLSMDISDLAVLAVVNNNLVSLRSNTKELGATALSRITGLTKTQTLDKLSTTQKRVIHFNRAVLLLQNAKYDDLQKFIKTLDAGSELTTLIQSSLLLKKGQPGKAVEVLKEYVRAAHRDGNQGQSVVRIQLSLAQLQLNNGNIKEALAILKAPVMASVQYEPAYLATLVTLHQRVGEVGTALNLLDETADKLLANKKTLNTAQVTAILKKSAELKMANAMWTQATATLEKILALHPNDARIKATLAVALASVDPNKAESFLSGLPKVTIAANAEALEVAPPPAVRRAEPVALTAAAHAAATQAAAAASAGKATVASGINVASAGTAAAAKKKKKRKNKPAKKATPGQAVDPERWIPRELRKSYKGRRQVPKKTGHAAGHQGTSANEAINKANVAAPSTAKAPPAAAKGPVRGGAPKKRGGKRR